MYSDYLDKDKKWQCTKCGNCCRFIQPLIDNGKLPAHYSDGKGGCKNLDENGHCKIYKSRPKICHMNKKLSDLEKAHMCDMITKYVTGVWQ